ncbi:hypothetical protein J2T13_001001 [Paenibacillus sp. DS2015]
MKMNKHHRCDHFRHKTEQKFIVKKVCKVFVVKVIRKPKPKCSHKHHHTDHGFFKPFRKHHEHPRPRKHRECRCQHHSY